ncbi:MAG: hypothetical protein JJU11_14120 [Candidatus Sumerlaeia bacterium]|nr:hypothetical protein [Candidatus Sumerlaeia bacterium]
MFQTDDLIYVPEGGRLTFDDVHLWRRVCIDTRKAGLRMRASAFERVSDQMRGALELVKVSDRHKDVADRVEENVGIMLKDLAGRAGALTGGVESRFADKIRQPSAKFWVRLSDIPAETFHQDDYEREVDTAGTSAAFHTYGNVTIAQLDNLEVAISGDEEGIRELPFSVDLPAEDGVTLNALSPVEPLHLIHEFCGVHGASSMGHTINLDTQGNIPEYHQFCTPLGTVGKKLLATLYFYIAFAPQARVAAPLSPNRLQPCMDILKQSEFEIVHEGPTHRIYQRGGDVVHVYFDLQGKEAEGVPVMPPLLVVACAGGLFDPMNRGALYEAIVDLLR